MTHVLLVEDNPEDIRMIQELLVDNDVQSKFTIVSTGSLEGAVAVLAEGETDVILLNLGLPDSQGLSTLRTVRSAAPSTPVVIITELDDQKTSLSSLEVGAEDYICKSELNAGLLVHAMTYAMQRRILTESIRLRTEEAEAQRTRAMAYFDLLAHDVANLISPILLICELTRLEMDIPPLVMARSKMVARQARRASYLISGLRLLEELDRVNVEDVEPLDLLQTISDVRDVVVSEFQPQEIEFEIHLPDANSVTVRGGRWTKYVVSHLLRSSSHPINSITNHIKVTVSPVRKLSGRFCWQMEIIDDGSVFQEDIDSHEQFSSSPQEHLDSGVATGLSFCASFAHHFGGDFTVRRTRQTGSGKGAVTVLRLPGYE